MPAEAVPYFTQAGLQFTSTRLRSVDELPPRRNQPLTWPEADAETGVRACQRRIETERAARGPDPRLSAKVTELKRTIRKWYRHYGSPQEEGWVVAQPLIRED